MSAYFLSEVKGGPATEIDILGLNIVLNHLVEGKSLYVKTVEPHEFAVPGSYPGGAPSLRTFPAHPKYGLCDECDLPRLHEVHMEAVFERRVQ